MSEVVLALPGPFAELLLRHRTGAGLGQRELARRSGLSERAIRDLERGVRTPRPNSARLVADALALTGGDLAAFLAAARSGPAGASRNATGSTAPAAVSTFPPGDLVGRDEEIRGLIDLVLGGRNRLVTVTGQAGLGKSRLAAELAARLAGRTDVAVATLDLSAVCEPELVGELVAAALGCGPSRLPPVDRVAAHLRDQRVLLVVDRFEQLVAAAGELATLVRRCAGLTLVVTSQRVLRVRGERVVGLRPLAPAAAVNLFARRATAVNPGFTLDGETSRAVAVICRRVGYLPLSIELAAARVRLMHPVELADRLDRQLPMLSGGARDLPTRHRSLRAALESSLQVVAAGSATLFRRLGVFAGGVRFGDVEAVAAALGYDRESLLAALAELVDMDLVRVLAAGTTSRYALADPVAELAGEQLAAAADNELVRRCAAGHFLARLRDGYAGTGPAVEDQDAGNVRRSIVWILTHQPGLIDDSGLRGIARFYEGTGRLVEGQDMLCRVATVAGLAEAWVRAGQLAAMRGDLATATELATRGLAAPADIDQVTRVSALSLLAQVAVEQGYPLTGRAHMRAALVAARRSHDLDLMGRVFNNLAAVSVQMGQPRNAERQTRAA